MVPYGLTGSVLKRCAPRHSGVDIELTCEKATVLIPRVGSWELDLTWSHVMIPGVGRFFRRPWFGLARRNSICDGEIRYPSLSTTLPTWRGCARSMR